MFAQRKKRQGISYSDHFFAAVRGSAWNALPVASIGVVISIVYALHKTNEVAYVVAYLISTYLWLSIKWFVLLVPLTFVLGWLLEKAQSRLGVWRWEPYALIGSLSLFLVALYPFDQIILRGLTQWESLVYFLAYLADFLIGAHAGWRYYVRLSNEADGALEADAVGEAP